MMMIGFPVKRSNTYFRMGNFSDIRVCFGQFAILLTEFNDKQDLPFFPFYYCASIYSFCWQYNLLQ